MKKTMILLLGILFSLESFAQALEEVIVTARMRDEPMPGIVLKRPGDFLLLEVLVSNDTREKEKREKEIYTTIENAIKTAKGIPGIELSLVENDYVIPLSKDNFKVELRAGSRPDTSKATIRVKTSIPDNQQEAAALIEKMKGFVKKVPVVGRSEIEALSSVDVSIVSPNKYRSEIIKLFSKDIKEVTSSIGDDYKVIVEGIDRPVKWVRSGPLTLALYIPYHYVVIPKNVNSVMVAPDY